MFEGRERKVPVFKHTSHLPLPPSHCLPLSPPTPLPLLPPPALFPAASTIPSLTKLNCGSFMASWECLGWSLPYFLRTFFSKPLYAVRPRPLYCYSLLLVRQRGGGGVYAVVRFIFDSLFRKLGPPACSGGRSPSTLLPLSHVRQNLVRRYS